MLLVFSDTAALKNSIDRLWLTYANVYARNGL